jgi:hypothetical protein
VDIRGANLDGANLNGADLSGAVPRPGEPHRDELQRGEPQQGRVNLRSVSDQSGDKGRSVRRGLCGLEGFIREQPTGERAMEIKRAGSQPSGKGTAAWFTGTVRIDPLFQATEPARTAGNRVTFEPGARTAWHTHPLGQIPKVDRARSAASFLTKRLLLCPTQPRSLR